MSNKVILLSMAGLLLGGLLFVWLALSSEKKEVVTVSLVLPTTEVELVAQLLNVAQARTEGARAVRERGVALRPIREYAAVMEGREGERVSKLESWSDTNEEFKTDIDWWGMPDAELAAAYIHFEQEQNQNLKQILTEARLFNDESRRSLAKEWTDLAVADEAQLQELVGLLPAI